MKTPIRSIMTNGEKPIELVLTKAEVIMRLSEEALEGIEQEAQESELSDDAPHWAHRLRQFIVDGVARLVKKQIRYPLDEIEKIELVGSKLVFHYTGKKHLISFEDVSTDVGPAMDQFSEADCRKFIESFEFARERYLTFLAD